MDYFPLYMIDGQVFRLATRVQFDSFDSEPIKGDVWVNSETGEKVLACGDGEFVRDYMNPEGKLPRTQPVEISW